MGHPFHTVVARVKGENNAAALIASLVRASQWFEVTPEPDDFWAIEVKRENLHLLPLSAPREYIRPCVGCS